MTWHISQRPPAVFTQSHLFIPRQDRFAYSATAKCGFLLVNGIVAVAAPAWWALPTSERILLCTTAALTPAANTESTVFLGHGSTMVRYRLLSVVITPGVHACMLCGEVPSLQDIEVKLVNQVWQPTVESLLSLLHHFPSNMPPAIDFPTGLLAVLVVHPTQGWAMYGHPATNADTGVGNSDPVLHTRTDGDGAAQHAQNGTVPPPPVPPIFNPSEATNYKLALVSWYHTIMSTFVDGSVNGLRSNTASSPSVPATNSAMPPRSPSDNDDRKVSHKRLRHDVSESYMCTSRYKCYYFPRALRRDSVHVMTLFQPNVPTFTLRSATTMAIDNLLASGSLIGI